MWSSPLRVRFLGVMIAAGALGGLCCPSDAAQAAAGPSFPCSPAAADALDRLTCSDTSLADAELRMVQTYYALRQVAGPDRQAPLKSEFLRFVVETRARCGFPPVQPGRDQSGFVPPANAASCVRDSYDGQRSRWMGRLSGPAAEEAARDPAANIGLQTRLRELGLLPAEAVPDGVFGTATRSAMAAWQRSSNRQENGFFGNADAAALSGGAGQPVAAPPDPWAGFVVAPLATAEYRGKPVVAASGAVSVRLAPGSSRNAAVCAKGKGVLLPEVSVPVTAGGECAVVDLTLTVSGQRVLEAPVAVLAADTEPERLAINVAIRRLAPDGSTPQVVLQGYTGGAHCCTATDVLTQGADGAFRTVELGTMDGDGGYAFLDAARDGSTVLVSPAGEFQYSFASYAGSYTTMRIQGWTGSGVRDLTKDRRFGSFQRSELQRMESSWRSASHDEPNGYLAAWVAQRALLGEFDDAWRMMLKSYDRRSTDGLLVCSADAASLAAAKAVRDSSCRAGYRVKVTFPEALAAFLTEHGYMSSEQARSVGFDPVVLARRRG